jgi:hypothetical protein
MREVERTRWFIGRCVGFVCASWVVSWRGVKLSFVVMVGASASPEHALVIPGGLFGSLGWWSDVCNLKSVCLLWAVTAF